MRRICQDMCSWQRTFISIQMLITSKYQLTKSFYTEHTFAELSNSLTKPDKTSRQYRRKMTVMGEWHLLVLRLGEEHPLLAWMVTMQQTTLGQHLRKHEHCTSHEDLHLFVVQTVHFVHCKTNIVYIILDTQLIYTVNSVVSAWLKKMGDRRRMNDLWEEIGRQFSLEWKE